MLDSMRAGMSGALVLRGELGEGKSALLDYAVERATDLQIVRTVAVESELAMGFAAVHQLLVPLLPGVDRLPEPQRRALGVAFGLVSGPPANPFLVGLAVLTLLADAAEVRPVLCVIDDAQWLDDESADTLSFVARRLLADRVGMLFAIRETTEPDPRLQSLPSLRIAGLPEQDAYELLETSISRPVDAAVAARIIAETGGNPLAIVEAAREFGSGPGRKPWWLHRRGCPAGTPGTADPRRGAAGRAAAVGSGRPPARRGGRPSGRPADRGGTRPSRSTVDRAGHRAEGQDRLRLRAGGRRRLRPGRSGSAIAAAGPVRREGRAAFRSGGRRVRRMGLQHCCPPRDHPDSA